MARSKELAELRRFWKQARNGHTRIACLLGPAGIGKTRLVSEFLLGVSAEGGKVTRARGHRGEQRLPWGTVVDLVLQLMQLPGAKGISSGSDAVLRSMVPSLTANGNGQGKGKEKEKEKEKGTPVPGGIHPATLADAVADLVEAVGFEVPLVVFLDDWQWVDKESRSLQVKVVRRMRGLPCLFLAAERSCEGQGDEDDAECLGEEIGPRRIVLECLNEDELKAMLRLWAECSPAEKLDELAARIRRITEGNPLLVGEVLRKLAKEGPFWHGAGSPVLEVDEIPEDLDLPESVQALFRERLVGLSPTAERVVAALVEEGRSIAVRPLRRRARPDEAVFARALWELLKKEVVTWVTAGELGFTHHQLATAARLIFLTAEGGTLREMAGGRSRGVTARTLGLSAALVLAFHNVRGF